MLIFWPLLLVILLILDPWNNLQYLFVATILALIFMVFRSYPFNIMGAPNVQVWGPARLFLGH